MRRPPNLFPGFIIPKMRANVKCNIWKRDAPYGNASLLLLRYLILKSLNLNHAFIPHRGSLKTKETKSGCSHIRKSKISSALF